MYKTAEAVKLFGGKITREPGPLPGISTKITACLDPDGWKSVRFWLLNEVHFDGKELWIIAFELLIFGVLQVFVDNIDFLKELE